jgi:hypothetical protein
MMHATPHLPQLATSFFRSMPSSTWPLQLSSLPLQISVTLVIAHSQPLAGLPSRSIWPGAHSKTHLPAAHFGRTPGTLQTLPQVPQFFGSVSRSAPLQLPGLICWPPP